MNLNWRPIDWVQSNPWARHGRILGWWTAKPDDFRVHLLLNVKDNVFFWRFSIEGQDHVAYLRSKPTIFSLNRWVTREQAEKALTARLKVLSASRERRLKRHPELTPPLPT